jgi:hypothetical protein
VTAEIHMIIAEAFSGDDGAFDIQRLHQPA